MQIKYYRSTWDLDTSDLRACYTKIKQGGFDGVEQGLVIDADGCRQAADLAPEIGLDVILQFWTQGKDVAEHIASFDRQFEMAVLARPQRINLHAGRDHFTMEENLTILDHAEARAAEAGIPMLHETHRGRVMFTARRGNELLEARPNLRITGDFSHWCCVHESLLEDQAERVERMFPNIDHIHARIGYTQGSQVPDPRDDNYEAEKAAHLAWWKKILKVRGAAGCETMTICPEFGDRPYLVNKPFTKEPVTDLWDVNIWVREWLKKELA